MTDDEIREYLKAKPLDYKLQEIGNELLRARKLLRGTEQPFEPTHETPFVVLVCHCKAATRVFLGDPDQPKVCGCCGSVFPKALIVVPGVAGHSGEPNR